MTSEAGTLIHTPIPICTDVLIVGAGPVGLFAAFEAGVVGLSCQIVDTLERIGGQCIELYPDKPIYDIPAIPSCTARELVDRLMEQCRPFDVPIHLSQRVETVHQREDGRWTVTTGQGLVFDTAAIMLAAGNGAFVPQRLVLPEATTLEERHVHYSVRNLSDFAEKTVVVAGGGDSALDWAVALRKVARRVVLVHRRNGFSAVASSVDEMRRAVESGEMEFMVGSIASLHAPDDQLASIEIRQIGAGAEFGEGLIKKLRPRSGRFRHGLRECGMRRIEIRAVPGNIRRGGMDIDADALSEAELAGRGYRRTRWAEYSPQP